MIDALIYWIVLITVSWICADIVERLINFKK